MPSFELFVADELQRGDRSVRQPVGEFVHVARDEHLMDAAVDQFEPTSFEHVRDLAEGWHALLIDRPGTGRSPEPLEVVADILEGMPNEHGAAVTQHSPKLAANLAKVEVVGRECRPHDVG